MSEKQERLQEEGSGENREAWPARETCGLTSSVRRVTVGMTSYGPGRMVDSLYKSALQKFDCQEFLENFPVLIVKYFASK